MKRLLACALATELVLGGLAVVAMTSATLGDFRPFGTPTRAALTGASGGAVEEGNGVGGPEDARGADAGVGVDVGRGGVGGWRGNPKATSEGERRPRSDDAAVPSERRHAAKKGISFKPAVDFATGATPSSADFNKVHGDQPALIAMHLAPSDSVVTGDFNGDGHTDVVQTIVLAGSLSVFLGDGRSGFAPPLVQPVGTNPNFVVAGDLDLDGHLDLAVADTGANGVFILKGDGKGGFATLGFLSVPAPRNVAIGTIDGDGKPDLAVASAGPVCPRLVMACAGAPSAGGVHTFVGLRAGVFRPGPFVPLTHSTDSRPVGANFVALHDFNGDGLGDLAVTVGTSLSAFDRAPGRAMPTGDDLLVFLNRGAPLNFGVFPTSPPFGSARAQMPSPSATGTATPTPTWLSWRTKAGASPPWLATGGATSA